MLPILLRPVDWEQSSFSHLPVLPINAEPINTWPNLDKAFVEVVNGIKENVVRKYIWRGQKLLSKGQPEKALIVCEKALHINQTVHVTFAFQGDILLNYLNRPEGALAAYQEASKLEPTNASHHGNIGAILGDLHRHEEAIIAFKQASELDPAKVSYHLIIGNMLEDLHRYEEAAAAYQKAAECGVGCLK